MPFQYYGAVPLKQGTSNENIKKKTKISWNNVPLNPTCVGHLDVLCIKWCKNAALAEHCIPHDVLKWISDLRIPVLTINHSVYSVEINMSKT